MILNKGYTLVYVYYKLIYNKYCQYVAKLNIIFIKITFQYDLLYKSQSRRIIYFRIFYKNPIFDI